MTDFDADVAVVGVGTMGSMCSWQAAREGLSVIGFEQFAIGHDRGAGAGETRIFRTAYKEGPEYVPMLKDAYRMWRSLEAESGKSVLTITGGLSIGDARGPVLSSVMRSIREHDLEHEYLDYQDAAIRYPQHLLSSTEAMIVDKTAGYVRPEAAIVAASLRAEALGARFVTGSAVEEIRPIDEGVVVRSGTGEYRVRKIVVTAGPWVSDVLPDVAQHVTVRRLIQSWFAPRDPKLFDAERFPVFTRKAAEHGFYGFPTLEGTMVKVAASSGADDRIEGASLLDKNVEPERAQMLREMISTYLPDLHPDPVRLGAYMEAYTSDHKPILGKHPRNESVLVAAGFSGHGFKLSPVIGGIVTDLLSDREPRHNIGGFDPGRFIA